MEEFDRKFRIFQRIIITFIVACFLGVIASWTLIVYALIKGSDEIEKQGLSGLVQQVWCGERKDCTLPKIME